MKPTLQFCDICDRPFPLAMLSEDVCADCWESHASDDLADEPLMAAWATWHARQARPLLLTALSCGYCGRAVVSYERLDEDGYCSPLCAAQARGAAGVR